MTRLRVAVIGGGLAGISAALAAADRGADVVLFERRSRLGGLTWSFARKGLWFDNGQHVFLRSCSAYRSFLERIGASDQVVIQPRLDVPVLAPGGVKSSISRSALPTPLHLAGSLARYRHLTLAERASVARAVLPLMRLDADDPTLDQVTFGEWLAGHGQSAHAVANLWDLIALPTLNVTAAEASLAMAVKVFRTGLLDDNDGGDMGWSAVPLRQLHAENATRSLDQAGVELRFLTRVNEVAATDDGGWTVSSEGNHGGVPLSVDAAIVATPPETAARLMPDGAIGPVAGLGESPIVNVHLVLDRRVTDLPLAACVDSPVQFVFDRTASSGVRSGQCLAISLSGADRYIGQRPEQLVSTFHGALADIFPAVRNAVVVDGSVSREHAATFRPGPGTAALRPPARTALAGLAVAGAWCDTGWPATMEGAVRSGNSAASVVVGHLRGPGPTATEGDDPVLSGVGR
jgi:squalene-associated FAD-dependent desaturase